MLCESLTKELGFDCAPINKPGVSAIRVLTPANFADGTPFNFFVQDLKNGSVKVTDDGETLFHFLNSGIITETKNTWRALFNLAETNGMELNETGAIQTVVPANQRAIAMHAALKLGFALTQWETERLNHKLTDLFFVDEVEMALRAWKPNEKLERSHRVLGSTKKEYTFDLCFGETLIDALKPNARTTAYELRKLLDVRQGIYQREMLVILDNRADPDAAYRERDIIGGIAKAMLFTDLQAKAIQAPESQN